MKVTWGNHTGEVRDSYAVYIDGEFSYISNYQLREEELLYCVMEQFIGDLHIVRVDGNVYLVEFHGFRSIYNLDAEMAFLGLEAKESDYSCSNNLHLVDGWWQVKEGIY